MELFLKSDPVSRICRYILAMVPSGVLLISFSEGPPNLEHVLKRAPTEKLCYVIHQIKLTFNHGTTPLRWPYTDSQTLLIDLPTLRGYTV